ncbi:hypothetical protein BS47DRAFT_1489335 [Hydnum rufescens UP504]|uniref:Fungal-type protein kinase domain-containing protein n=1 Tax=Hydnum rufescens UP504 TaxID=1448309 RepID=A0A9P6DPL9_9AGAM|nr:hypothetical protein BS47DRAFT_1489335 [Hydnum rufescens UP504]
MNNIMFCSGENNRAVGVLNDFDSALFVQVNPQYGSLHFDRRFRTGTAPFMALELLDETDKIQCVRHDLESFLWVTIWCTSHYHGGIKTTMAFQDWQKFNITELAPQKGFFLFTLGVWEPTAQFGRVAVWLGPLFHLFCDARNARQNLIFRLKYGRGQTSETLAMETLGGHTTYQTFLHILGDG